MICSNTLNATINATAVAFVIVFCVRCCVPQAGQFVLNHGVRVTQYDERKSTQRTQTHLPPIYPVGVLRGCVKSFCVGCCVGRKTERAKPMAKLSLRKAVNAKCKECIHDPICGGGTWRQQVEKCTSSNCPLYAVRPRSIVKVIPTYRVGGENRLQAVNDSEKGQSEALKSSV